MTDNEPTGRELAVACAKLLGAECNSFGGWYLGNRYLGNDTDGPVLLVDEMLAWLTKDRRGCVQTSHVEDWVYTIFIAYTKLERDQDRPCGGGPNLSEALQRLVVSVAERITEVRPC